MKNYYIPSAYGGLEQVTKEEYLSLFGDKEHRSYVNKLYCNTITINDIPEELRESVQSIVKAREYKYGKYANHPANQKDIQRLVDALINREITKGEINQLISALSFIRENSTDEIASKAVNVFPVLKADGSLVKAGTRICWDGAIKRAAVDLWDTAENWPDFAPSLWEDINYKDGYRIIPEVITAGTAFSINECGWWKDRLYKSLISSNVYTPDQYSAGWQEVDI